MGKRVPELGATAGAKPAEPKPEEIEAKLEAVSPLPLSYPKLAWDGKVAAGRVWTVHVLKELQASSLLSLVPKDIGIFTKADYKSLPQSERVLFWAHLFSKMAEYESGFQPHEKFQEPDPEHGGPGTLSVGLLQLSYEDEANYGNLPKLSKSQADLENPLINLTCAIRIAEKLVAKHSRIQGLDGLKYLGMARYWSVLRAKKKGLPRKSFTEICSYMQDLRFKQLAEPKAAPVAAAKKLIDWLTPAKAKWQGKKETDPAFSKEMSRNWKLVGLSYTSIAGSSRAWCGLFVAAMLAAAGLSYQKNGAAAKNWDQYGQKIDWRVAGIPRRAIVRINHAGKCSSGEGNHVTTSDADCSAKDLLKPGASFPAFGGNQGNTAKVSRYKVSEICTVRWPKELMLPDPVTVSKGCGAGSTESETTR